MDTTYLFQNRKEAGRVLATKLTEYAGKLNSIVIGLPRGGVPVACEVAEVLDLPFDILVVRKLGVPGHQELAFGAIASGGILVLNEDISESISRTDLNWIYAEERRELEARERKYRGSRAFPSLTDKQVIIVDDGIATGASMRVAIKAIRAFSPTKVVVAVPVAPSETLVRLREFADEVVSVASPKPFYSVSRWYRKFGDTTDAEVLECVKRYEDRLGAAA